MSDSNSLSKLVSSGWIDSTSHSLVQRVKRDEPQAWERLVPLYSPLVASWCRDAGLLNDDIADVVQEVFRSVSSAIDRFEHDRPGNTFRGWLRVITRHKLIDFYAKQQRSPQGVGGTQQQQRWQQMVDPCASELDDKTERREANLILQRALEIIRVEFEESTWRAFWRVVVDDRSPADVAQELNTTRAAVYKAKSRVLLRLRKLLGAQED